MKFCAEIHVCILGVSEEPMLPPSPAAPLDSAAVGDGKKMCYISL